MKRQVLIGFLLLLALSACHSPQREARHMVARAERLFDTLPDSTASLIDSVLRMPVYFNEKRRMDMALLQAEALMGDRGQEIPPLMDDEFFDDKPFFSTSPELERAYTTVCDRSRKISCIIGANDSLYQTLRDRLSER